MEQEAEATKRLILGHPLINSNVIEYSNTSLTMKRYFKGLVLSMVLVVTLVTALPVSAQLKKFEVGSTGLQPGDDLLKSVEKVVNVLLGLVAFIAVIVLVYAGVKYIISFGEEDEAEQAKRMILYALIGLVVVGLSAVIVNFTLGAISGQGGGGGNNAAPAGNAGGAAGDR